MSFITKLFNKKQVDYYEVAYPKKYYCGYEIEVKDGAHSKKSVWSLDNITFDEYLDCLKDVQEKINEAQQKLETAVRNGDTFVVIAINLIRVSDFIAMRMNFGEMENKS